MEISRKNVAAFAAPAITGFVKGWREAAGPMLSACVAAVCWKQGAKKTAIAYGALTVAQLGRLWHGYDDDEAGDQKFCEALEKRIAGPDAEGATEAK